VFDAAGGILSWTPGYDQAGVYQNITVVAGDGITTSSRHFNLIVAQGYAKPVLASVAQQTLREGERYALQLAGHAAGSEALADGTAVTLEYSAPWLPGGAKLNTETGWLEWTPDYNQHGAFRIPVTLTATWTTPGNDPVITSVTKDVVLNVLNANGAPVFDASASLSTGAAETWNILEGQTLQISAFAFDPDNPDFEPRIRFQAGAAASGPETTAATVSYDVSGLPDGATFDPETLEIRWTPGFAQAGTYSITVTATDDGDPLRLDSGQASTSSGQAPGVPAVSHLVLPIVVGNANRAPDIGDISNAFVDKGSVIEIPVSALDADGNPIQISISGLPRFATYTQNPSSNGTASGVIRFAPGANDRGDYTITVVAQDNGDPSTGSGPTANNNVLTQAKSFVLTVRSETEAPVITAPRQVVAVVGQPLSVALLANDRDQDALTWSANGLPIGAEILAAIQYGHATLAWTPTAADIGSRDIELVVTDSGLAPENAGYVQPENPTSNVTKHTLRVVVRAANAAPEVLGVQVNGSQIVDTGVTAPIQLNASEGVPLTIELFGRDTDADLIEWAATGLPRGMTLDVPNAGNGKLAVLRWTPDLFAAQDSNTGSAGQWRFSVRGSDGAAQFERSFEVNVANVNQTPRLLPMPLQLVNEGRTVNFTMRAFDADNDAVSMGLVYDGATPSGVVFDSTAGYFEWTPDQSIVNGALENDHPYTFTFQATDGSATTTQTVQVRVFDTNRLPQLTATNHALVIGQTLSLPVELGAASNGISANDPDGAEQTAALAISFANLPEGAGYDAQMRRLNWVPGPGQIGDFTVTASVSDGKNTTARTFTLRVVAEASANQPKITVSTTPSTPALPGQTVIASVRADAWSGIADIVAEVRGSGLGDADNWQTVALDSAGRIKLLPTQPGLIEVRVTATDNDSFVSVETHTVRIKDPADTAAPLLAWMDTLSGATAVTKPVEISQITSLKAGLVEQQLMGYKLQIAPAGSDVWQTLAEHTEAAISIDRQLDLISIDPSKFANGVYQLRLSAWDLVGRTTEIEARIIIDTAQKDLGKLAVTDNVYRLAGHILAFNRSIDTNALPPLPQGQIPQEGIGSSSARPEGAGQDSPVTLGWGEGISNLGNWQLALLDTGLTTDQPATTPSGATASWQEGARVWLQIPENLSNSDANLLSLSFTLNTSSERLGQTPGAPQVFHPEFSESQGWQLQAHTGSANGTENLMRLGSHLYDQSTGLPWLPSAYTLIAPDGSRYELDANGLITSVTFTDGAQWLITDAGIAAVNGDTTQRVDIQRDSQGRISRVTGPDAQGESVSTVYRYDAQGRLELVRNLNSNDLGTPLAYDSQGKLLTDTITAKLGAAVNWLGDSSANQWTGELVQNTATTLAFNVRESELASTVHSPGAQGAIVYAIETELPADASIEVTGATLIGNATVNGKNTLLVRVTEAGVKLIRLNGAGVSSIRISVAGDLNRDGNIDGADSGAWQQNALDSNPAADLNGDGQTNAADRQLLYANVGFKANLAPSAVANLPQGKTHTDLATKMSVSAIAQDMEGDSVFLRVLNTTHGSAKLSRDGSSLIFTPEAGYTGQATVTLQADDGYALGAPIELNVNVSGAALTSIRITNLAELINLQTGQSTRIHAVGDFTDEQDVDLTTGSGDYLTLNILDLSSLGKVGAIAIAIDDSRDLVSAKAAGAGLISLSRTASDAQQQTYTIRTVAAINIAQAGQLDPQTGELIDTRASLSIHPDVYPGTLTLIPGSTRQLKVHVTDPNTGLNADVHEAGQTAFAGSPESTEDYVDPDTGEITTYVYAAIPAVFSGTRYSVSDDSIATVSDSGLITALRTGQVTVSIVHLGSVVDAYGTVSEQVIGQSDIKLSVQTAQLTDNDPATAAPQTILVNAHEGAAISAETGETVLIGAGALKQDTPVAISRIDLASIDPSTTIFAAQPGGLEAVGAFTLNIGSSTSAYPLQLAIPVQNGIAAQAGDEVWFLRKGKVLAEGSTSTNLIYQDTWWVVDNGYISLDANGNAIAKTASPPYGGLDASGEYMVYKKLPGVIGSPFDLVVGIGDSMTFAGSVGLSMSFGSTVLPIGITSNMIGIVATMATTGTASSYHFGVPQFANITTPTANELPVINISAQLPPVVTPYGNIVVVPNITDASATGTGIVTITVGNNNPGQLTGKIMLRALFANGTHIDVQELGGATSGVVTVDTSNLKTKDGKAFAVGSVNWQLVRIIPGYLPGDAPIEFAGSTASITAKTDMAATLTRTGIDFIRQNKTVGQVNLVNKIGTGTPIAFSGTYLTGNKVQPIAFTTDLSRAYVAGSGVIYEIDLVTFKLIDTIAIQVGKNIVSLVSVDDLLLIGEGQGYGAGAGSNRLLAMNIEPGSQNYNLAVTLKNTNIESTPLGVGGMSIGPDGKTLVVATPKNSNSVSLGDPTKRGDILVFDLTTLNLETGAIAAPIKADLPSDGISGKASQVITATNSRDRFLVANVADYNRGLSTLTITRDAQHNITGAKLEAINMSQPSNAIRIDRLDIQRAQSAVLVEQDGIEYAIVSDDNYHFNDPYWKAMYEAPSFIFTPFGPPLAVGGSASAKKVAVGGKLGIVKDPFGLQGDPEFIGATLPLDGYGIVNLSLSENGKVLIGQLKGGYSGNIFSDEWLMQKPNQNHAWNVDALIQAALAMPTNDRMSKHIKLPPEAEQLISAPASAPAGTTFDAENQIVHDPIFITGTEKDGLELFNLPPITCPSDSTVYVDIKVDGPVDKFLKAGAGNIALETTKQAIEIKDGTSRTFKVNAMTLADMYKNNAFSKLTTDELYGGQVTVIIRTVGTSGLPNVEKHVYRILRWVDATDAVAALKMVNPGNPGFTNSNGLKDSLANPNSVVFSNTLADGIGGMSRIKQVMTYLPDASVMLLTFESAKKSTNSKEFDYTKLDQQTHIAEWVFDPLVDGQGFEAVGNSYSKDTLDIKIGSEVIGSLEVRGRKTKPVVVNLNLNELKNTLRTIFSSPNKFGKDPNGKLVYKMDAAPQDVLSSSESEAGNSPIDNNFKSLFGTFVNGYTKSLLTQKAFEKELTKIATDVVDAVKKDYEFAISVGGISFVDNLPASGILEGPQIKWRDLGLGIEGYVKSSSGFLDSRRDHFPGIYKWLDSLLPGDGIAPIPSLSKQWALTEAINQTVVDTANVSPGSMFGWRSSITFGNALAKTVSHELAHTFGVGEDYYWNQFGKIDPKTNKKIKDNPYVVGGKNLMGGGDPAEGDLGFLDEQKSIIKAAVGIQSNEKNALGAALQFYKDTYYLYLSSQKMLRVTMPSSSGASLPLLSAESVAGSSVTSANFVSEFTQSALKINSLPANNDQATSTPTLTNSDVQTVDGWLAQGSVAIIPSIGSGLAGGAALLKEGATSQTRLNQVFVLGEHDRFLSFTLANSALGDQAAGPDDAFEVALLDANTGLSLLGPTGLTRNDAFLNLQANGEEHKASGITRIDNADSSRTYLVDLGGIAAGTAVNLSFDLIGFGQGSEAGNSQITVRDLRLGVPQTVDDSIILAEDTPTVIDALANDINALQPGFIPVIVNAPSHGQVAINADGSFSFRPESDWYGEDSFTYKLSDSRVDSNLSTVTLTVTPVNDAPVAADNSVILAEDSSFTIDLLALSNDIEGDTLASAIVNGPAHGSLSQNTDGSWIYTPDANYNGADSFTYKVNDGELDSNFATVTLTIVPVNDVPTAGDQRLSTDEDMPITGSLLAVAADIDSALLQGSIVAGPQHGQVSVAADGSFTYLADANYNGADSFTYKVNDGELDSAIATVMLTVVPVNDTPTAGDQSLTTDEDTPITGSLLAVAADIDSALLQGSIVVGPQHGQVSVASDGSFTYTPDADYNGVDSFTYKVNDGDPLTSLRTGLDSAIATVMLTVVPVNDAPTAGDQSLTTDEDTPITGSLLAVAADIDSALLQGSIVIGPQHGQVSVAADGSFTYIPDTNYNGADSFIYKVNDGELDSAIATVMLTIIPVNDAPVASVIAATLLEDGRITLNLLGSASDVDGDPLSVSVGNPQHGQLLKNADGSYTYLPQADYNGEDSFSYAVSDGQLDSGPTMVRLTITVVNDAPVAQDDTATLDEDHSIQLAIMDNDHDVDGDSLSLIIVDQPAHGTLVVNADNTVSYTPMENWSGEDSFSYKLNDGELDSGIATVRLIINAVADAPALVLSEVGGASRELFRTGWERVGNRNTNSTLLEQRELEGWTFVARPGKNHGDHDDHDEHDEHDHHDDEHGSFEIWSSGDLMRDAQGKRRIVNAAGGNGNNWLELNNAKGEGHETLGIERSIETLLGASYTLSLDLAGHLGYGADYTRIGIYLDGVKIGSDESTSSATALNWQTRTFQFTGTGGAQALRIVSEASQRESNGRGMMIDNIALSETLQSNTGFEDGVIPLSVIGALLQDTDGSETLSLAIGAIPVGATLTDGINSFTASQDNNTADITGWNLGKLTITPTKNFNGQFALKIVATSTEQANQSQASIEADLLVTVLSVNDAPLARNASYTLSEGGSIVIDFAGLISDVDGDVLTLSLTNPKKGTLTKNPDGTYTYTPKREFSGTETFTYTVFDGKLTTTASITLIVLPKKDHDEEHDKDHHDNGRHQGFEHSQHNGYPSYDDQRSATIIVQSVHADYRQQHDDRQDTLVINQKSSRTASKVDWTGQAPNLGKLKKDHWIAEQLTERPNEKSLAEQTGLVVKIK